MAPFDTHPTHVHDPKGQARRTMKRNTLLMVALLLAVSSPATAKKRPLVWETGEPYNITGFIEGWQSESTIKDRYETILQGQRLAEQYGVRDPAIRPTVDFYTFLVQENLVLLRLSIETQPKAPFRINAGDLEITFANGAVIRDQGLMFFEESEDPVVKQGGVFPFNRQGVTIKRPASSKKPIGLVVLVPENCYKQWIDSIEYTPQIRVSELGER
jgi:hypothetical protein